MYHGFMQPGSWERMERRLRPYYDRFNSWFRFARRPTVSSVRNLLERDVLPLLRAPKAKGPVSRPKSVLRRNFKKSRPTTSSASFSQAAMPYYRRSYRRRAGFRFPYGRRRRNYGRIGSWKRSVNASRKPLPRARATDIQDLDGLINASAVPIVAAGVTNREVPPNVNAANNPPKSATIGIGNRTKNTIQVRRSTMSMCFKANPAQSDKAVRMRLVCLRMDEDTSNTPASDWTWTEFFAENSVDSNYRRQTDGGDYKYSVIFDNTFAFTTQFPVHTVAINIPKHSLTWDDSHTLLTNFPVNNRFIWFMVCDASDASNQPILTGNAIFRFSE